MIQTISNVSNYSAKSARAVFLTYQSPHHSSGPWSIWRRDNTGSVVDRWHKEQEQVCEFTQV